MNVETLAIVIAGVVIVFGIVLAIIDLIEEHKNQKGGDN